MNLWNKRFLLDKLGSKNYKNGMNSSVLSCHSSICHLIFEFLHYTVRQNRTHRQKWRHTIIYTQLGTHI